MAAPVDAASIEAKLKAAFEHEHVAVEDESGGCGSSFRIVVVSPSFDGMPLLERQRAVHSCLGGDLDSIHAVQIKAWTPAQYAKKKAAGQA